MRSLPLALLTASACESCCAQLPPSQSTPSSQSGKTLLAMKTAEYAVAQAYAEHISQTGDQKLVQTLLPSSLLSALLMQTVSTVPCTNSRQVSQMLSPLMRFTMKQKELVVSFTCWSFCDLFGSHLTTCVVLSPTCCHLAFLSPISMLDWPSPTAQGAKQRCHRPDTEAITAIK